MCAHASLSVFIRYIYIITSEQSFDAVALFYSMGHPSHHDNDPVAVDIAVYDTGFVVVK